MTYKKKWKPKKKKLKPNQVRELVANAILNEKLKLAGQVLEQIGVEVNDDTWRKTNFVQIQDTQEKFYYDAELLGVLTLNRRGQSFGWDFYPVSSEE